MKFDGILLLLVTLQQTFLSISLLNQKSSTDINRSASTPIIDPKIIGWEKCPIEKHPYAVSIRSTQSGIYRCGGSLLSSSWVLTAAHCCDMPYEPRSLTVKAGTSETSRGSMQSSVVYDCLQHPDYDNNIVIYYDIALLHLEFPIKKNRHIDYVKLPNDPNENLEETCNKSIVIGWGDQYEKDNLSETVTLIDLDQDPCLYCVELPVVNQSYCQEKYDYLNYVISDTIICAYNEKKDACQGDSGGPLVCDEVQYGIASTGIGCENDGTPELYTRVDKYEDFIHSTIKMRNCAAALYSNVFFIFSKLVFFCFIYYNYLWILNSVYASHNAD